MQQDSQPGSMASAANKGNKRIKGCIRCNNGKYILESKDHKMIWLTGPENFASHVDHTVMVHGSFLKTSEKADSRASSAGQGSDFQVKQIDTIADRCTLETQKAK
jgi:hypothetical protein